MVSDGERFGRDLLHRAGYLDESKREEPSVGPVAIEASVRIRLAAQTSAIGPALSPSS